MHMPDANRRTLEDDRHTKSRKCHSCLAKVGLRGGIGSTPGKNNTQGPGCQSVLPTIAKHKAVLLNRCWWSNELLQSSGKRGASSYISQILSDHESLNPVTPHHGRTYRDISGTTNNSTGRNPSETREWKVAEMPELHDSLSEKMIDPLPVIRTQQDWSSF